MSPVKTAEIVPGLSARAGGLPLEVDTFVGRRAELDEIRRQLGEHPLVTLVGPGGVGKTRLALRSAAQMGRTFSDGVRFVELGTISDPALLLPTIAEIVGMHDHAGAASLPAVVEALADRRTLLVVDNCEHLIQELAELAAAVLQRCPGVRIIATSRERLGIAGEAVLQVRPLPVPAAHDPIDPTALPRFEAVSLFAERARAVVPDFELTGSNGENVARICREIDGIPLAIELAAARLRTLAPAELADRLGKRLSVLTTGNRAAPTRHQTMRLCVDWSYEACTPAERLLWERLSVFGGPFGIDAVEDICAYGDIAPDAVLDLLGSLVEKSIVSRDGAADHAPFRLLATLREYGRERSVESLGIDELRDRHLEWYAHLTSRARAEQVSAEQQRWAARLDRELPNLRAALEHGVARNGSPEAVLQICGNLHLFWISRGLLSEGRLWLDRVFRSTGALGPAHAPALFSAVALSGFQGDVAAASTYADRCRTIAGVLDDSTVEAYVLSVDGMVALFDGDLAAAQTIMSKAADAHRDNGDILREVEILVGLALACGLSGDAAAAAIVHQRILDITEPREESWYRSYSLWALGIALWREGEHAQAAELLVDSLQLRRRLNDALGSLWCLEGLALVALGLGQLERSAVLLAATSSLSTRMGSPPATFPDLVLAYERCRDEVEAALDARTYKASVARGAALDVNAAIAYALGEADSPAAEPPDDPWDALTRREREVAKLVARGMSNRAIAETLVISPRTAENHVEHILTKLGLSSRSQVAAWVAGGSPPTQSPE
jgi:predicted ATPase/DNA-binding CsgD family transcriptional regulator